MTHKGASTSEWSPEAIEAFETLKVAFSTAPVLSHLVPWLPFTLEVDASETGVGAVLGQKPGPDKTLRPCGIFSRKLTKVQSLYDVGDRELLAIILALRGMSRIPKPEQVTGVLEVPGSPAPENDGEKKWVIPFCTIGRRLVKKTASEGSEIYFYTAPPHFANGYKISSHNKALFYSETPLKKMSLKCNAGGGALLHRDSYILLNDGHKMPVIALGTFSPDIVPGEQIVKPLKPSEKKGKTTDQCLIDTVKNATKMGLDIGYRHVDGAYLYQSETGIGQAFREKFAEGTLKREDVFYTSKLWNTFHQPQLVRQGLLKSLEDLQLDYIDLYIIHMPMSMKPEKGLIAVDEDGQYLFDNPDLLQTWEALEECKDAGLVKSIGVSNFNRRQLEMILNKPGLKYKPVCNQIECHPYLNQKLMLDFCKSHDIVVVAYGVVGSPGAGVWTDQSCPTLLKDPVLTSIGEKYNKTSAQVCIRYIIQRGAVAIIKSFNPERMKQNLQVFDFSLSPDDMKAIDGLNRNVRYWKFLLWEKHPQYPFHCEY
ncbi:prostaglandin F synthase 1-like [Rhinophrynus dorsalis]